MTKIIKGNPISKIEEIEKFTNLDYVIVSKVSDAVNQIPNNIVKSYKIQYGDLSASLIKNIKDALHLSSMAFKDCEEFSRINHRHDYQKVKIYPYFKGESFQKIASITVDNVVHDIRIPNFPTISYDDPDIGELKMIYTKSKENLEKIGLIIDHTNENFSGWVPADGKTYSKQDFPEAFTYFSKPQDITEFSVPNLDNFFSGNYGQETSDQLKLINGQIGIGNHTHDNVTYDGGNIELHTTIQIPTTRKAGQEPYCHSGGFNETGYLTRFTCDLNITGENKIEYDSGKCEYAEDGNETYPTYNYIPILVYIGKRKNDI